MIQEIREVKIGSVIELPGTSQKVQVVYRTTMNNGNACVIGYTQYPKTGLLIMYSNPISAITTVKVID